MNKYKLIKNKLVITLLVIAVLLMISGCNKFESVDYPKDLTTYPTPTSAFIVASTITPTIEPSKTPTFTPTTVPIATPLIVQSHTPEEDAILPLSDEDFVIKDKNNYIELFAKYENLITNEKIVETSESNEHRAYYIFIYENFELSAVDIIASIDLTTPALATARGIIIGDKLSDVLEKYGDTTLYKCDYNAESDIPGQYCYSYNSKFITFFIDETGIVVGITLEIL